MAGDGLIGHTGFVGGNLARGHAFAGRFNSKTIGDIRGRAFDTLVFAAAQARKWWANQNPAADWAGIQAALDPLADVRSERLVLISTIDVVPPGAGRDEAAPCHGIATHAYGENQLRLEDALRARFARVLIVRLPGLFGPGLAKNVIFDLGHDNMLEKINPDSSFQYYDLARLWPDIERALAADLGVVHLVPAPVTTATVIARFFPGKPVGQDAGPAVHYDYRTRHAALFGGRDGHIYGAEEVLDRLGAFVASQ